MFESCCNILSAALDGLYGWQDEILTILAVLLVFNVFAKWGLKKLHKYFESKKLIWRDSFVQALFTPLSVYVWFFAFVHAANLILPQIVTPEFFEQMHILLKLAGILSVAWFLMRWKKILLRLIKNKIARHELHYEQSKVDVIDKLITIVIIFMTVLFSLEVTNRSMSTLIAFGGIGGLALAFASQEVIANYFSGVMIYLTRPFTVGDWISLPERNIEGYVEEIGWYMTRVRTFEKRPIYIPNSIFSKVVVVTPSRMSYRKFKENFGLRYVDLPKIRAIMADISTMLKTHPDIENSQRISVYLDSLSDTAVNVNVSAYSNIIASDDFAYLKEDLLFRILDIIKGHDADLASPVTVLSMPEGLALRKS